MAGTHTGRDAAAEEPGAPIAHDQIDPELVKLARPRPKVGVITAAGLVLLSAVFLWRLHPDRRFSREGSEPTTVAVADVLAGTIATDRLVAVAGEPVVSQAIRATAAPGSLGYRVVPVRGTSDRLWIAASGDGWEPPAAERYVGRLRKLEDLAFADAARRYATEHPRPVFASAAAVRAGLATSKVTTVAGDQVALRDGDAIALDVIDPRAATIAASFNERLPDVAAWTAALRGAGLSVIAIGAPDAALGQVRFAVGAPVAETTSKLELGKLYAARVEPVTRHHRTTWATLHKSPPAGLDVGGQVLPDTEIDLVGLYVSRGIPADAYVLVTGELPEHYWYVMPITIALAAILVVFAWALLRALRRDLAPPRAA